jgi:uncharacterized membrane protein YdjX (TVP38/TMEM64 family)
VPQDSPDQPSPSKRRGPLTFVLAVASFATGAWAVRHFELVKRVPEILEWFRSLGPSGLALFAAAYVLACVLLLPASVLTLGAGAVFGVPLGFALVSLASTLGATASFLIARFVARDWVGRRIASNAKFAAVDAAVGREGWKIVGLLRLSPIFPFNLLNYALGITRVSLRDFVLASWIGMMPGTLLYVWLGAAAGDLARAAAGDRPRTTAERVLLIVGLLVTVLVTVYVTRLAKRALGEKLEEVQSSKLKVQN